LTRDINIEDFEPDKDSWFNVKKFKIGNTSFEKSEKAIDSNYVSKNDHVKISRERKFKFCESRKIVKKFSEIREIYNESRNTTIKSFFHKYDYSGNLPHIINFTFNFLPPSEQKDKTALEGFYDHYHSQSNFLLTVPNLRVYEHKEDPTESKMKRNRVVSNKQFIDFVDRSVETLDTKNHRPIFVPVSLRLSLKDIDELVIHYVTKQYYDYWFDFEGLPIYEDTISRIRRFSRFLNKKKLLGKTVFYFTNCRREIMSNFKDNESAASDILCSLAGANIVGIDREPSRYVKKPEIATTSSTPRISDTIQKTLEVETIESPPPNYKARLLEAESYYYVKTSEEKFLDKSSYTAQNSVVIANELDNQTDHFRAEGNLNSFLSSKKMLTSFRNGSILKKLMSKSPDTENSSIFE
jgi:hypothetical protein